MTPLSADTNPAAEAAWLALLREAPPVRHIQLVRSLTATVVRLARQALRDSRPGATEAELSCEFVGLCYGPELAEGLARRLRQGP